MLVAELEAAIKVMMIIINRIKVKVTDKI